MFAAPRPPARGPKKYKGKVTDMNKLLATLLALALTLALLAGCAAPATPASIVEAKIDENGDLLFTMSNGAILNAGRVRGEDGTSVESAVVDESGDLQISLSDDTVIHAGHVRGADGQDGADGRDGADGQDGRDGRDGVDGKDGRDGIDGIDGKDGADGRDGTDGRDGANGKDGADGEDGTRPYVGENGNWWIDDVDLGVAGERESVTPENYSIRAVAVQPDGSTTALETSIAEETVGDYFTITYDYDECIPVQYDGGTWRMALVTISGFKAEEFATVTRIEADGVDVTAMAGADSPVASGLQGAAERFLKQGELCLPTQLPDRMNSMSYLVRVLGTAKDGGEELQKFYYVYVRLDPFNTEPWPREAVVTRVESETSGVDVYRTNYGIQFEQEEASVGDEVPVRISFADMNRKPFTKPIYLQEGQGFAVAGEKEENGYPLTDSQAVVRFSLEEVKQRASVTFHLRTEKGEYITSEVSLRYVDGTGEQRDPLGICFAESSVTIAVGETYRPIVLGVVTGGKVDAILQIGEGSDNGVIELDSKGNVVGVQPGVAYISAEYTTSDEKVYTSSSMKITVTGA